MVNKTVYRVHFYDTDTMGVVHHANYIRWFEIGRVEFLRQVGITLDEMMDDGYLFPIVDVAAKFHAPSRFDDVLIIETTPRALTRAKMAFDYRILRESDGTLLVTGHSQNVFTGKTSGTITRLPQKYFDRLKLGLE